MAPKSRHKRKMTKFDKFQFFHFSVIPIESSIDREISIRLYHRLIMWSNTLSHGLSNALSTITIRHIEKVEMAFKVVYKKRKIKKIQN